MPKVDFRYLKDFISEEEFSAKVKKAEEAHRTLMTKSGAGNDFTGFVELPEEYDREEFSRIISAAEKIRKRYPYRYRYRRFLSWSKSCYRTCNFSSSQQTL